MNDTQSMTILTRHRPVKHGKTWETAHTRGDGGMMAFRRKQQSIFALYYFI